MQFHSLTVARSENSFKKFCGSITSYSAVLAALDEPLTDNTKKVRLLVGLQKDRRFVPILASLGATDGMTYREVMTRIGDSMEIAGIPDVPEAAQVYQLSESKLKPCFAFMKTGV